MPEPKPKLNTPVELVSLVRNCLGEICASEASCGLTETNDPEQVARWYNVRLRVDDSDVKFHIGFVGYPMCDICLPLLRASELLAPEILDITTVRRGHAAVI